MDTITPLTRAGIKSLMSLILGQIGVLLQGYMPLSIETFPLDLYKWRKCCGHNNAFSIYRIIIKLTGNQGIKSWMSSNSSHIRPLTLELPALERRKKCCGHDSACILTGSWSNLQVTRTGMTYWMSLNSSHIHLTIYIRLDRVKSRRRRAKGTKTPFWNFSKKTSVANKKERRHRKLKMRAQSWKFER